MCPKPYNKLFTCMACFQSVQFSRLVVSDSLRPRESRHSRPPCPSPTPRVGGLMSIESVMPSSHLIFCRPLLLLPPIPPSTRDFSNKSTLHMRWLKYSSFRFSIRNRILRNRAAERARLSPHRFCPLICARYDMLSPCGSDRE